MRGSKWDLIGKSVLITGAVGGIGAATARLLAARQTHLSLMDVQGSALHQQALNHCHSASVSSRITRAAKTKPR